MGRIDRARQGQTGQHLPRLPSLLKSWWSSPQLASPHLGQCPPTHPLSVASTSAAPIFNDRMHPRTSLIYNPHYRPARLSFISRPYHPSHPSHPIHLRTIQPSISTPPFSNIQRPLNLEIFQPSQPLVLGRTAQSNPTHGSRKRELTRAARTTSNPQTTLGESSTAATQQLPRPHTLGLEGRMDLNFSPSSRIAHCLAVLVL